MAGLRHTAALLFGLAAASAAQAQTPSPVAAVDRFDAALLAAMKLGTAGGFAGRNTLLGPAVDGFFDLPSILRGTIGLHWASIPPDQQTKLLAAFRAFTIASYAANFDAFSGQTIVTVPPPVAAGADQLVQTKITSTGSSNRIDYQMRAVGGAWRAEDVLLDGTISNVAVQRSDFRKLLGDGGAQKLIDSLTKRTTDLATGTPQ